MSPSLFVCVICDEKCDSKDALRDHFRNHATGGGKLGVRNKDVKKSSSAVPIQCDVCSEMFESASKAISHKFKKHPTSHSNHFCPWCGKQFTIKQILNIHLETHSDKVAPVNVIPCNDCGATFYTHEGVEYHYQLFHKKVYMLASVQTPPPSKKIYMTKKGDVHSVYYCHFCGNEYIIKYNLQRHIKSVHSSGMTSSPEDLIKCKVCDALFYSIQAYDFHKTFHTPTDLYITSEEMRQRVVTRVDQDFDFRRVKHPINQTNSLVSKVNSNIMDLKAKIFADIGNMSSLSPPPKDSDSDDDDTTKNKSETQTPSENAITIDEFLDMNKDVFGDCFSNDDFKNNQDETTASDDRQSNAKDVGNKNISLPQDDVEVTVNTTDKPMIKNCKNLLEKFKPISTVPRNIKKVKIVKKVVVPKGVLKPGMQIITKKDFEILKHKGLLSLVPTNNQSKVFSSPKQCSPILSSNKPLNLKEVRVNLTRLSSDVISNYGKRNNYSMKHNLIN